MIVNTVYIGPTGELTQQVEATLAAKQQQEDTARDRRFPLPVADLNRAAGRPCEVRPLPVLKGLTGSVGGDGHQP